jgi:hypothetical protein
MRWTCRHGLPATPPNSGGTVDHAGPTANAALLAGGYVRTLAEATRIPVSAHHSPRRVAIDVSPSFSAGVNPDRQCRREIRRVIDHLAGRGDVAGREGEWTPA